MLDDSKIQAYKLQEMFKAANRILSLFKRLGVIRSLKDKRYVYKNVGSYNEVL